MAESQCIVATVDYRLAPEHPFPAASDDAMEALRFILSPEACDKFGIDVERIAVGGTSA